MIAARHQAGNMRHIDHEERATGIADLTEFCEVNHSRVGAGARDNQLWLYLHSLLIKLVVVDSACLRTDAVCDKIEITSRHIDRGTMRQMAAFR